MMDKKTQLKPWMIGPIELIQHGNGHFKNGAEFDKRMALISYDNSIEVSIAIFLELNPAQRNNHQFNKEKVNSWLRNYHSKLDFLKHFIEQVLKQELMYATDEFIYIHKIRNELYHGATNSVPREDDITLAQDMANWVFKVIFGIDPTGLEVTKLPQVEAQGNNSETYTPELEFFSIYRVTEQLSNEFQDLNRDKNFITILSSLNNSYNNYIQLFDEAKNAARVIREGSTSYSTDYESLNPKLEKINTQLGDLLDDRAKFINDVFSKTQQAIRENNQKIGLVHVPMGAGLSNLLEEYLELYSKSSEGLSIGPLFLLFDNQTEIEMFLKKIKDNKNILPVLHELGANKQELQRIITLQPATIIVSTYRTATRKGFSYADKCLVVSVGRSAKDNIIGLYPNGFYIHFANLPAINRDRLSKVFGENKMAFQPSFPTEMISF